MNFEYLNRLLKYILIEINMIIIKMNTHKQFAGNTRFKYFYQLWLFEIHT